MWLEPQLAEPLLPAQTDNGTDRGKETPQSRDTGPEGVSHSEKISYTFTGKVTLLPLTVILLGSSSLLLMAYWSNVEFQEWLHEDRSTGRVVTVIGVLGLVFAVVLIFALLRYVVIKLSICVVDGKLVVKKHGLFRRSELEFVARKSSLHYFKTHYNEDKSWLRLVVREGNQHYIICSWKGKGNQKRMFGQFFNSAQALLGAYQGKKIPPASEVTIFSEQEIVLSNPFRSRRKKLLGQPKRRSHSNIVDDDSFQPLIAPSRPSAASTAGGLATSEDIPMELLNQVSYDKFFQHFSHSKKVLE